MRKMGLFWFAAALLGAALIFSGCETEADEKIVYVPGEMIHLDVVVKNVTDLKAALAVTDDLAIGFDGSTDNVLTEALEVKAGKAIYILNGGTLKTANGFNLTVKGIVYVGIGGILDVSAGNVVVDGGQVSVLPAKSVAAITAGVPPGTLVIASATSVTDKENAPALGKDNVWIGGAVQYADSVTALTGALVSAAFSYVQPGGTVNVGVDSSVAATETVTVPAGKILNVAAALTVKGTLNATAGSIVVGSTNSVTLAKASVTGDTTTGAVLDGSDGSVTLAATDKIELAATGVVTIAGTGKVVAGTTFELSGVGAWTAGGDTVTFEAEASNKANITGGTSATLTPSGTAPELKLLAASAAQELTIGGTTKFTLDLSAAGKITFASTTAGSTIKLTANTDGIKLASALAIVGTNTAGSTHAGAFVVGTGTYNASTKNVSLVAGVIKHSTTDTATPAQIDKDTVAASLASTAP